MIIYPMMVNVRFEALMRAGRNLRGVGIAMLFNFVWAPLVGLATGDGLPARPASWRSAFCS